MFLGINVSNKELEELFIHIKKKLLRRIFGPRLLLLRSLQAYFVGKIQP